MQLTTFRFFIFALLTIVIYFSVPKKGRWIVLLVSSMVFYGINGIGNCFFILITAASTFFAARWIMSERLRLDNWIRDNSQLPRGEQKAYKRKNASKRKTILILTLILNFGLLVFFKYSNFLISQVNYFLEGTNTLKINALSLVIPLGISFYTFTSMGYLIDTYWNKCRPQQNFFRLLLFTSFFAQILQGPISTYNQLGPQLYEGHDFNYINFKWGFQRFIWGLVKKLAISNVASEYITALFENHSSYSGLTVFLGILLYAVYIYADFSGYMDMVCGICQIMGIELAENFNRPYFSKSIAEYWRRGHITLGEWFKNYIYYIVGFSRPALFLSKKSIKVFGRTVAKNIPGTMALIVVWFATGLWHGASYGYIVWGLLNGAFIIASMWLKPAYTQMCNVFHIKQESLVWKAFQVIRTFILVAFIKILPEAGSLKNGLDLWKSVFANRFLPTGVRDLFAFIDIGKFPYRQELLYFCIMCVLTIIMFVFSMMQRKKPVRESFNRIPMPVRTIILAAAFVMAIEIGATSVGLNGAFLYEQF